MLRKFTGSFSTFSSDIKLWHSVFALPFVLASMILNSPLGISWAKFVWIVLAMVCARSFAMGANRYLDREIDKQNPRTKNRALPAGKMSPFAALMWTILCGLGFVLSSLQISFLCGVCSFGVLVILFLYPIIKKVSHYCHFYLGFCLALAPIGAELASSSTVSSHTLLLALAVMLWTSGFDILYATQDIGVDRSQSLHSLPASLGSWKAVYISRMLFAFVCLLLLVVGWLCSQNIFYYFGVTVVAGLLVYEHYLLRDISESGTSKNIGKAFFDVNAGVSIVYFFFTALASLISSF
jgi:4-hydroxybenzoate polyprenyltransferase